MNLTADEIIAQLGLQSHPEGGHFRETWRADAPDGGRASGTAIYFLLKAGEVSHWHKVDAAEIWHWYAGAPLELSIAADGGRPQTSTLGPDLANGQYPQVVVPPQAWQSARSAGDWTLVGCTVSPGFEFAGFELAAPDWAP
ncbi:MAG: cupin domain-containing protein [Pseudomonadota bacterium]